ncbi:hypothetical protein PV325_010908, partial [Microctonus aethiopoides]
FQDADVLIGPHVAYQHITKARAGLIPNVPNSLSNLPDIMSDFPNDLKSSYFGCFKTEENEVLGVVFSSPKLMEIIGHYETTELFIDGTFDVSSPENARQCPAISGPGEKTRKGYSGDDSVMSESHQNVLQRIVDFH